MVGLWSVVFLGWLIVAAVELSLLWDCVEQVTADVQGLHFEFVVVDGHHFLQLVLNDSARINFV